MISLTESFLTMTRSSCGVGVVQFCDSIECDLDLTGVSSIGAIECDLDLTGVSSIGSGGVPTEMTGEGASKFEYTFMSCNDSVKLDPPMSPPSFGGGDTFPFCAEYTDGNGAGTDVGRGDPEASIPLSGVPGAYKLLVDLGGWLYWCPMCAGSECNCCAFD